MGRESRRRSEDDDATGKWEAVRSNIEIRGGTVVPSDAYDRRVNTVITDSACTGRVEMDMVFRQRQRQRQRPRQHRVTQVGDSGEAHHLIGARRGAVNRIHRKECPGAAQGVPLCIDDVPLGRIAELTAGVPT